MATVDIANRIISVTRGVWQDVFALGGLTALAVLVEWEFLTTGDHLVVSYGDWLGHVYRTRFIQEYGLATWDHNWAGGMSLFQSHQFVPHVVTAWLSSLGDASIGRAMLFEAGALLVWVRCSGYVTARALGLSPLAGLAAGAVTFGATSYMLDVISFPSLWALAALPLIAVGAFRLRNHWTYPFVGLAAGLSIYVHPHLGVAACCLLAAASIVDGATARGLMRLAVQLGLAFLAASFFWVPIFFSAKPAFVDPYPSSARFMHVIFDGQIEEVATAVWFLLPLVAITLLFFRRWVRHEVLRFVAVYGLLLVVLILVSYGAYGNETIRLMQNVRLIPALGLPVALAAALAVDALLRSDASLPRWWLVAPAVTFSAALVFAGAFALHARDRHLDPVWLASDPVNEWLASNPPSGRVFFDDVETPLYTFLRFDEVRSTQSHSIPSEWSIVKYPMHYGLQAGTNFEQTAEFMRAMGVSHVAVRHDRQPLASKLLPGGELQGALVPVVSSDTQTLYRTPWEPVMAFLTDVRTLPKIQLPDLDYLSFEDGVKRYFGTTAYNRLAYDETSTPVTPEYPDATTIRLVLSDLPRDQFLVVNEDWDRSWKAESSDGRSLRVERFGPNYVGVDLSPVSGDVVVELRHEMSRDWKAGIALTVVSVPLAIVLALVERVRRKRGYDSPSTSAGSGTTS